MRGAVGGIMVLWVVLWGCGSRRGSVGHTMGLWVTLWG